MFYATVAGVTSMLSSPASVLVAGTSAATDFSAAAASVVALASFDLP